MSPETGVSSPPMFTHVLCRSGFPGNTSRTQLRFIYPENRRFKRIKLIKASMRFERQSRKKQKRTSLMESAEETWSGIDTVKPLLDAITMPKRPKISFCTGLSLFRQHLPDNVLSTSEAWKLYLLFVRFGEVDILEGLIVLSISKRFFINSCKQFSRIQSKFLS